MPKETTTIQCYPSDKEINEKIKLFETFGWEVINNQRCQEFTGQDSDGTRHFETFNKITFSREKGAPWYDEVRGLEAEYVKLSNWRNSNIEYQRREAAEIFGLRYCTAEKPVIATPKKFYLPLTLLFVFLAFILLSLVLLWVPGFAEFIMIANSCLSIGLIGTIVSLILLIKNKKCLKGLKGEEATKALQIYEENLKNKTEIDRQINEKCDQRLLEIENRCAEIIK